MSYESQELKQFFEQKKMLTPSGKLSEEQRNNLLKLLLNPAFEVADTSQIYSEIKRLLSTQNSQVRLIIQIEVALCILETDQYRGLSFNSDTMLRNREYLKEDFYLSDLEMLAYVDDYSFQTFIEVIKILKVKKFVANQPQDLFLIRSSWNPISITRLDALIEVIASNILEITFSKKLAGTFMGYTQVCYMSEFICAIVEKGKSTSLTLDIDLDPRYYLRLFHAISRSNISDLALNCLNLPVPQGNFSSVFHASIKNIRQLRMAARLLHKLSIEGFNEFLLAIQSSSIKSFGLTTSSELPFTLLKNKAYSKSFCSALVNSSITKLDLSNILFANDDLEIWQDILLAIQNSRVISLTLRRGVLETKDKARLQLLKKFFEDSLKLKELVIDNHNIDSNELPYVKFIPAIANSKIDKIKVVGYAHSISSTDSLTKLITELPLHSVSLPKMSTRGIKDDDWELFLKAVDASHITSLDLRSSRLGYRVPKSWDLICKLVQKGKLLKLTLGNKLDNSKRIEFLNAMADNFLIQLKGSSFDHPDFQKVKERNSFLKSTIERAIAQCTLLIYRGAEADFIHSIDDVLKDLRKTILFLEVSSSKQAQYLCVEIQKYIDELLWKKSCCLFHKTNATTEEKDDLIKTWLAIRDTSEQFELARMEIFQLSYANFVAVDDNVIQHTHRPSYATAFIRAVKYLLKDDGTFISLSPDNRRIFDGFLWKAANGDASFNSVFLPTVRVSILRYVQLLALIDTSNKRLSDPQKYIDSESWREFKDELEGAIATIEVNQLLTGENPQNNSSHPQLEAIQKAWIKSMTLLNKLPLSENKRGLLTILDKTEDLFGMPVIQQSITSMPDQPNSKRKSSADNASDNPHGFLNDGTSKVKESEVKTNEAGAKRGRTLFR